MDTKGTEPIVCMTRGTNYMEFGILRNTGFYSYVFFMTNSTHYFVSKHLGEKV